MSDTVCSFCKKGSDNGRKFIAGQSVYICDDCVKRCIDILGWRIASPHATGRPLTKRQAEIYDFIARFLEANRYAPSFEEIAENFQFHSLATVHEHLTNLERKGWIRRAYNESRAIELVAQGGQ